MAGYQIRIKGMKWDAEKGLVPRGPRDVSARIAQRNSKRVKPVSGALRLAGGSGRTKRKTKG